MATDLCRFYPHNSVPVTFDRWRWRSISVVVRECRWTQAASGAAGTANVGLCRASSLRNILVNIYPDL